MTGRWNLGPHHSVDMRLHMDWKTLAHHAGKPCCRPCKTPATFSIYWGLSRWWSAPWGSWWLWGTWQAGWCQDQAPEGNLCANMQLHLQGKLCEGISTWMWHPGFKDRWPGRAQSGIGAAARSSTPPATGWILHVDSGTLCNQWDKSGKNLRSLRLGEGKHQ